ncbi:MAG: ECF transporter S component [Actinomycetes bacterium]|jgi:energy-coupling factor transport system substrate-specific component
MMLTSGVVKFSSKNTFVLAIASLFSSAGFIWPFFYRGQDLPRTQFFFWIAIFAAIVLVIVEISTANLDAKSVALLGVLAALISALRPLGAGAVGIEPMWFVLILSARVFGASFGFLLGIISMFASALLTGGLGPWLGYQMFAAAWIGTAAGLLPKRISGKNELAMLIVFGIVAAEAFGILMDLQFWPWALGSNTQLSFIPGGSLADNAGRFISFHFASAMAWDIPRAVFTCVLIGFTGPAVLSALRRTYTRAAFSTPVVFSERVK